MTDTFNISGVLPENPLDNNIAVDSTNNIEVDTSLNKWPAGLNYSNIPVAIIFGGQVLIIAIMAPDSTDLIASLGQYICKSFSSKIYLEHRRKLVLDYDKIEVKSGGIYAGGDPKD